MASWATIGFQIGFRSIERAYRASRKAFEEEIESLEKQWQAHLSSVEVEGANTIQEDDDSGYYFDYGEHIGELQYESEEGLRLVREAFAIALYHYWEKEMRRFFSLREFNLKKVFDLAKVDGRFSVDEGGIEKLRLIANCIKHDSGKSLYTRMPDLFDVSLVPESAKLPGWHRALKLRDADLTEGLAAVRSSGPRSLSSNDPFGDVEL